jgi:hypothetical protein
MKHLILFSAFLLLVATACSKPQRMSRRIDGSWKATKMFGTEVDSAGQQWTFEFKKAKKGKGTGTLTIDDGSETIVHKTRYTMKRDDRMNLTVGDQWGAQTNIAWDISELGDNTFRAIDVYGDESVLVKL